MRNPTVICITFLDEGTDPEAFLDVVGGGGFRARVLPPEGDPTQALLSGGAGLDAFNLFEMLEEDRVPFLAVNAPARATPDGNVGDSLGPGLDSPVHAQRKALLEAAGKPWRFLFAALRGPFTADDLEETLTTVGRAGGDNPYVFLLHLPPGKEGWLLGNGPGIRWVDTDGAEEATVPEVTATLLSLAESHLVADVDGHPLPVLKTDVDAARRDYVTR